ncbi:protein ccsmst1 [Ictalurus furcatus]|uniref:protein ccsmst1 n=1 Tax=Ictalurus furcatus TaxID=66913 RepID=UPI002350211C|nr:protein ccsmst1 [Ictalurus furcatus]
MSAAGRCVFSGLLRYHSLSPGQIKPAILRPCIARSLSISSQLYDKPRRSPGSTDGEETLSQPIKFSTSKASHRTWKVERSMGSRFQRPWWKVLPISVFTIGFLLWCIFRQENDIDRALEKHLFEHLPGLLTNMEEETEEREELKKEPDDGSK